MQLVPDNSEYLNDFALNLYLLGEYSAVEPLYKKALLIDEKALGKEHLEVTMPLINSAMLYKAQGKYAKAEILLQRAVEIFKQSLVENHPNTKIGITNLEALHAVQAK